MGVKPDSWIRDMATRYQMIAPFVDHQVRGGISYGLSSYGYDFRLAPEFYTPVVGRPLAELAAPGVAEPLIRRSSVASEPIDPKKNDQASMQHVVVDEIVIPAGGYLLGRTIEYFRIPRDVLTICYGKSTYARCGVAVHVTPFEPEWEGTATIAIVNCSGRPARIYANEGIGQLLFLTADGVCETSYADRKGKYQAQQAITPARMD